MELKIAKYTSYNAYTQTSSIIDTVTTFKDFIQIFFKNTHIALLFIVFLSLLFNTCLTIGYYFSVAVAQCGTRQAVNLNYYLIIVRIITMRSK